MGGGPPAQGGAGERAGPGGRAGAAAAGEVMPPPRPAGGQWEELFVPGRLCLLGEHSDWAGGLRSRGGPAGGSGPAPGRCLVVGTPQGLFARARQGRPGRLEMASCASPGDRLDAPLDPAALAERARSGSFFAYVCGTAARICSDFDLGPAGGLELDLHRMTLPMKVGLSSSAAVCVLVARAFSRVFGLRLSRRGEMEYAYQGERLTPSLCGRMDQACAFGGRAISLRFDGDGPMEVRTLRVGAPLRLVLVGLRGSKDTVAILRALHAAYPSPACEEHRRLHGLLGAVNEALQARAEACIAAGDVEGLGAVLGEAQAEFDSRAGPLCPEQLGEAGSPKLHALLRRPELEGRVWGGKGVGSQGDGCAQLLCRGAEAQAELCRLLAADFDCLPMTIEASDDGGPLSPGGGPSPAGEGGGGGGGPGPGSGGAPE